MPRVEVRYTEEQLKELLTTVEQARGRKVTAVRTVVSQNRDARDQPTGEHTMELVVEAEEALPPKHNRAPGPPDPPKPDRPREFA